MGTSTALEVDKPNGVIVSAVNVNIRVFARVISVGVTQGIVPPQNFGTSRDGVPPLTTRASVLNAFCVQPSGTQSLIPKLHEKTIQRGRRPIAFRFNLPSRHRILFPQIFNRRHAGTLVSTEVLAVGVEEQAP